MNAFTLTLHKASDDLRDKDALLEVMTAWNKAADDVAEKNDGLYIGASFSLGAHSHGDSKREWSCVIAQGAKYPHGPATDIFYEDAVRRVVAKVCEVLRTTGTLVFYEAKISLVG